MNAHRKLKRQLKNSVRDLHAPGVRRRGWLRPRLLLVVAPLALVGGVAGAATTLVHSGAPSEAARRLAYEARQDTFDAKACAPRTTGRPAELVDDPPLPQISAALPGIDTPSNTPIPAIVLAGVGRFTGSKLLRKTVHVLELAGDRRLVVLVTADGGPGEPTNPAGCLKERLARLADLQPDAQNAIRHEAEQLLRDSRDTIVGRQTLWLLLQTARGAGGSGTPVLPGGPPLQTGVVFGGSSGYGAIVKPGTTAVTVENARPRSGVHVRLRLTPRLGLVAFALPRRTGHMRLVQRAADGRVIAVDRFR